MAATVVRQRRPCCEGLRTWLLTASAIFIWLTRSINRIRKVDVRSGIITTIAGDGSPASSGDGGLATAANVYAPWNIDVDDAGNVFFWDRGSYAIREISATSGIITTVATGVIFASAMDGAGNIYFVDAMHGVRKVESRTHALSTVFPRRNGGLFSLYIDTRGDLLLINNHEISKFSQNTHEERPLISGEDRNGVPPGMWPFDGFRSMTGDAHGNVFVRCDDGIWKVEAETLRPIRMYKHVPGELKFGRDGNLYLTNGVSVFRVPVSAFEGE